MNHLMKKTSGEPQNRKSDSNIGTGLAIGIAIGTAIGVSTDNIGLWLPVGIAIGLGIGSASARRKKRDELNREE